MQSEITSELIEDIERGLSLYTTTPAIEALLKRSVAHMKLMENWVLLEETRTEYWKDMYLEALQRDSDDWK